MQMTERGYAWLGIFTHESLLDAEYSTSHHTRAPTGTEDCTSQGLVLSACSSLKSPTSRILIGSF